MILSTNTQIIWLETITYKPLFEKQVDWQACGRMKNVCLPSGVTKKQTNSAAFSSQAIYTD
jgi:hypothetical protein